MMDYYSLWPKCPASQFADCCSLDCWAHGLAM